MSDTDKDDQPAVESVTEKLEDAADHVETAEKLREEAKRAAVDVVESELGPDTSTVAEYNDDYNGVMVKVVPSELSEEFFQQVPGVNVSPLTIVFGSDYEMSTSFGERERIKNIKGLISKVEEYHEEGAPIDEVLQRSVLVGLSPGKAEQEIEKLRTKGEVYEPKQGHLRTT